MSIPSTIPSLRDPTLKLLVTHRLLHLRGRLSHLWSLGDYLPLDVTGPLADHLIAFGWRGAESQRLELIAVIPRFVQKLIEAARQSGTATSPFILPTSTWQETSIVLPADSPSSATCIFSAKTYSLAESNFGAAQVLADSPVAVLETVSS